MLLLSTFRVMCMARVQENQLLVMLIQLMALKEVTIMMVISKKVQITKMAFVIV